MEIATDLNDKTIAYNIIQNCSCTLITYFLVSRLYFNIVLCKLKRVYNKMIFEKYISYQNCTMQT